jgi:hypothetical protein
MDTVAAELMEWEELSLEDLEDFDREARSEELRVQDPLTEQVPPQIQESALTPKQRTHRFRRALAAMPKGDPLRRITP